MTLSHSPNIVRDGLVLYLDAGNPKSYPGTGTTWADLSGNANNGTLVNGVGYDGDNQGGMIFDGVNDRVETNYKTNGGSYTLQALIKPYSLFSDANNAMSIFGEISTTGSSYGTYAVYINQYFDFGHFTNVGGQYDLVRTDSIFPINNFYYISFVRKNGIYHKIYINGVERASGTCVDITNTSSYPLRIGRDYYGISRQFNGKINIANVYNKALSEQEIKQNFNALRGRYGI